jgi:hypothetical protein
MPHGKHYRRRLMAIFTLQNTENTNVSCTGEYDEITAYVVAFKSVAVRNYSTLCKRKCTTLSCGWLAEQA